jgi:hypothetical protein
VKVSIKDFPCSPNIAFQVAIDAHGLKIQEGISYFCRNPGRGFKGLTTKLPGEFPDLGFIEIL